MFVLLIPLWLAGCDTARQVGTWFSEDEAVAPLEEVATGETNGVLDKPKPVSPADIRRTKPDGLFADRLNATHGPILTAEGTALPPALPPGVEDPAATLATMPAGETALIPASPLPPPAPVPAPTPTPAVAAAPAPVPLGPEVPPEPGSVGSGRIEMVGIIFFANASAQLDSRDREVLEAVVALHRQTGGIIRILGYASDSSAAPAGEGAGPSQRDLAIAQARAESVGQALLRLGVEAVALVPEGQAQGGAPPYEFMPEGEAGERRSEIYLEY